LRDKVTNKDIEEFKAEARTMLLLPPHPNVVMFRGWCAEPDLAIVTDFCDGKCTGELIASQCFGVDVFFSGGSLYRLLHSRKKISDKDKFNYIVDIAKGVLHLHSGRNGKEFIHRYMFHKRFLHSN
jgi:serine/threonine protein kinase